MRPPALLLASVLAAAVAAPAPLAGVAGVAGLGGVARAGTLPGSPLAQLRAQNERIDRILKSKPQAGSPAEKAAKEELKSIVNNLLDYRELARRSLGVHWDKLTAPQREEFVSTLRELIEKNYVKQLRTNLEYEVIYKNESVQDGDAKVSTVVKVRTKGKSTDTSIEYKMHRADERWVVYDVITDEVSMVQNYRAQFNRIITNESYDALIKKMRKKIEESEAARAAAK